MKKHLKLFTLAVFAMVSLLFATASMAQTNTTGSVDGVIADSTGAVVPNVTVTISGPNLIRAQTTTSDGDGAYRFLQIPPGRYSVSTAAVSGFGVFKQDNIEVNLAQTTTVKINLSAKGVGEVVDVVASSEIDTTSNTTGSNISTEFFSNIPTSRTVQGLYTIAPTVTRSGLRDASGRDRDPSVAGSSGPENSYILDGVTTTDPAFGGGGANLPFEFVQEVQVKTGSYGADQGLSTGGVFNVITKSGTNQFHGDVFAFFGAKDFVRETKNFPLTGIAPNGFSEIDAGADLGGPIAKDKLWFFGAFNPQRRKNNYLTQGFRREVEGEITTPFYSGKLTWAVNNANTFTFSTFSDLTKEKGHLFQTTSASSGFGANANSYRGDRETGGSNYAFRLNTNAGSKFIGEFSFGLHFQRNNLIPDSNVASAPSTVDNYAILRADGTVAPVTQTGITGNTNTGQIDFVYGGTGGGVLQRNFTRGGFSPILFGEQDRDRWEFATRMQSIAGDHTFKYGFEYYKNKYDIAQRSTGPSGQFPNPLGVTQSGSNPPVVVPDDYNVAGFRVTNRFFVCVLRSSVINCPSATAINRLSTPGVVLPTGLTLNTTAQTNIALNEFITSPFLVRNITRVRDFRLNAQTDTAVQSFYIQDDYKVTRNLQVNLGGRWDFQQANGNEGTYLKLNDVWENFQPRLGVIWDPFKNGKGKIFANFARYVETPIPLDVNVRAGSNNTQIDKNFNVQVLNAPLTAPLATGFATRNLGAHATPIDAGLKPQTVNEWTAGFEYEVGRNYAFGFRGIYRPQGSVIEDGSFDDGDNYFLFNPGEPLPPGPGGEFGNTEYQACNNPAIGCFGRARRYYRGVEFTFNRRFANNVSFQTSYVYSSLIGNYEGLFRNDNGQADPNITSLFDLVSLLGNSYGRLPNDRPHQFKFNGSYQTPWKFVMSGNFYAQSGIPFNKLTSHPVYGDNEGFGVIRGTAIIPDLGANSAGVESAVGGNRTPTTMNLDLGIYVPFKFGETKQLRFSADWFNVFNAQRAVTLDNSFENSSGLAGVPNILNPFYGSGAIFQYPSSLRLGAKFSF